MATNYSPPYEGREILIGNDVNCSLIIRTLFQFHVNKILQWQLITPLLMKEGPGVVGF